MTLIQNRNGIGGAVVGVAAGFTLSVLLNTAMIFNKPKIDACLFLIGAVCVYGMARFGSKTNTLMLTSVSALLALGIFIELETSALENCAKREHCVTAIQRHMPKS